MVSNVLNMPQTELLARLERFRLEYADDPEYQELRGGFPADWPL